MAPRRPVPRIWKVGGGGGGEGGEGGERVLVSDGRL